LSLSLICSRSLHLPKLTNSDPELPMAYNKRLDARASRVHSSFSCPVDARGLEALLQPAEWGIVSYQRCGASPAADAGPLRRATGAGLLQRALAQGLGGSRWRL
ncbi:unnamed protein product, partial [Urochloa humidicola]